jgi:nucleoside-diphosphate-sugar epimerase
VNVSPDNAKAASTKAHVLVTGATGLVGNAVVQYLAEHKKDWQTVATVRSKSISFPNNVQAIAGMDLKPDQDWSDALENATCVVHCAAVVHQMHELSELAYHEINVEGTLNLARQSAKAGVTRFIFISSIKVNGEKTLPGKPFNALDMPNPHDAYARSKAKAEFELMRLGKSTEMEIVIIRPPLVYGPGVKANFGQMLKLVKMGLPLPLKSINNKRSLVALSNLVDLIVCCIENKNAANGTFLVSDDQDISTPELFKMAALAVNKKPRLMGCPESVLRMGAKLLGRSAIADRLCDSLHVDISETKKRLGWAPVITMQQALKHAVDEMS